MKRKKTERILISLLSIFIILTIFPAIGNSAVPETINYQGYLTDSGGAPIDGTVQMTFSIYDVVTGGAVLWNETQTVTLSDGIYNVNLGEVNPVNLSFDTQYYLGVTVGTDAEMTPRQSLTSVPYAMNANRAEMAIDINDNAVTTSKISAGAVTSGKIANDAVGTAEIIDSSVASADVGFNYAGSVSKGGPADNLACIGCVSQSELDFTAGDITAVNPGAGLTGGGATGDVTLGVDTTAIQNRVAGLCPAGNSIRVINEDGTVDCEATGTQTGLWIDPNNYNSINAAVADASGRTVIIYDTQPLAGNLTVPANVGLFVIPGGKIAKASTFILTINGPITAGAHQIFSGFSFGDITLGNYIGTILVEWFGAIADGTTDNTTAIQMAIDSAEAKGGGKVYLSEGTYLVNTKLIINNHNVIIEGVGQGSILKGASGITVLSVEGFASGWPVKHTKIANMQIKAQGTGIGLQLKLTFYSTVDNVYFNGGETGIFIDGGWRDKIQNSIFRNMSTNGILTDATTASNPGDIYIQNNYFNYWEDAAQPTYHIRFKNWDGGIITGNTFFGGDYQLYFAETQRFFAWTHISNNQFFGPSVTSIHVENLMKGTITNNNFAWWGTNAIKLISDGSIAAETQAFRFVISNNFFESYSGVTNDLDHSRGEHVIYLTKASRGTITGNTAQIRDLKAGNTYSFIYLDDETNTKTSFMIISNNLVMSEFPNYQLKHFLYGGHLNNSIVTGNLVSNVTFGGVGGVPIEMTNVASSVIFDNNHFNWNQIYEKTIVWDPGSIADGDNERSPQVVLAGVGFGDFVEVGNPYDLGGMSATAYVESANVVKIVLQNNTGRAIDLGSGTWRVRVKRNAMVLSENN